MKGVRARMRVEWIKAVLGKGCRFTVNQFKRVRWRLAERGWLMAAPTEGPALERVVVVNAGSAAYGVVRAYGKGERWFAVEELSRAVGASISGRTGAIRLATVGLALLRVNGDRVELRSADPRAARFVNEARLGPQVRGFSARRVIEAFLLVRPPERRRINITDERRLLTADVLAKRWFIECDDLLNRRLCVRLVSTWAFDDPAGSPAVECAASLAVAG